MEADLWTRQDRRPDNAAVQPRSPPGARRDQQEARRGREDGQTRRAADARCGLETANARRGIDGRWPDPLGSEL